jgi:hypothetical protein
MQISIARIIESNSKINSICQSSNMQSEFKMSVLKRVLNANCSSSLCKRSFLDRLKALLNWEYSLKTAYPLIIIYDNI